MTLTEAAFVGVLAHYYPDAASITDNFPRAFLVQRYEDRAGQSLPDLVHGVLQGAGSDEDTAYGDAYSQWGGNPWGRNPVEVSATPEAGKVVIP